MSASTKKIGEVARLMEVLKDESLSYEAFAESTGCSARTVSNTVFNNTPLGVSILRGLLKITGVSLDWVLTGEGEKYRANARPIISYSGNGVAVHNNHGSIGVGEVSSDTGGRGLRLCDFVKWWMETHGADDQAWLESQITRAVPEYQEWKKGAGK